ncbi:MAG: nucleotidyltransferase family protein [Clostridium sp.]|uniref:nucleotidyltransferase family protein n=1 Tax=Clostridium sp. TaxID=1506 RepID=UPI003D6D293C
MQKNWESKIRDGVKMPESFLKIKSYTKSVSAIILAGGYSMRMKQFKPLLPLGDSTVIENTVNVFRNSGVCDITVVIGFQANDLRNLLDSMGVKWVYNQNYKEGMYSSIVAGVRSLPDNTKGFFLLPADMPLIEKETIEELLKVYNSKEYDIIYPEYKGKRGHPPLISSRLFPAIKNWDGCGGLRVLLSQYQKVATQVEVMDENILNDMDTPEDYINLCKLYRKFQQKAVRE